MPEVQPVEPRRLRDSLRRQGAAIILALLIEIGIGLLMLYISANITPPEKKPPPLVFGIQSESSDSSQATKTAEAKPKKASRQSRSDTRDAPRQPQPVPTPPPEIPPPPVKRLDFMRLTPIDYAASDIGRGKRSPSDQPTEEASAGASGTASDDTPLAGGKGPHGEPLYAAEWYREPSDAQLNGYLPPLPPERGWGEVACRTIAGWHVEDCIELGEAPRASGYARAVRQAAWQFLVRPPRKGGQSLVGSWVRIHIDYRILRRKPGDADSDPDAR